MIGILRYLVLNAVGCKVVSIEGAMNWCVRRVRIDGDGIAYVRIYGKDRNLGSDRCQYPLWRPLNFKSADVCLAPERQC